jgi:CheY-like chemotaxis protein
MSTVHRIALLGFSAFERNTLGSYFRLASTREPRYEQVQQLQDADFVVADADHEPSVTLVAAVERLPETIFVGSRAPEGAIAWLTRPIDPLRVLRELDVLAVRRRPAQPAQAAAAPPSRGDFGGATAVLPPRRGPQRGPGRSTVIQPTRPERPEPPPELLARLSDTVDLALPDLPDLAVEMPMPAPTPISASMSALISAPISGPLSAQVPSAQANTRRASASMPAAAAKPAASRPGPVAARAAPNALAPSRALLVDDSDLALRFLQKKLAPYGLSTDCVTHADAALARLAERRYDFVFLDMELGEGSTLDGLALCQRIKGHAAAIKVVMVTAHHTELDRVRGALAGCDGFLGKPLDDEELDLYLQRHGLSAAAQPGAA